MADSLECDAHDTTDQSERQTSQAVKTLHTKGGKDRKSTNIPETAIICFNRLRFAGCIWSIVGEEVRDQH